MNYVISIIHPDALDALTELCQQLGLPMTHGDSTAGAPPRTAACWICWASNTTAKRIVLTVASPEKTRELIRELKRKLFLGMPGQGITIAVPVKSVGGGKTLAYLSGEQSPKYTPELNFDYELILAIANEGCTDLVMNAARAAGATGGTVVHGKGTGSHSAQKFYAVSLASEKEIVLILTKTEQKTAIMRSILKEAGPDSPAGSIVFSLPVTEIAGFGFTKEEE